MRTGNRITLTDAGHAIYPQTSRALNDIAAMTTRILEGDFTLTTAGCQCSLFIGRILARTKAINTPGVLSAVGG